MQQETLKQTQVNRQKVAKLREIIDALLDKALERGFYGVATVAVRVQDGTIQEIEERIERKHR
jgi:tRNA(Ser,Leu) C12 N-acetylase TAN1